MDNYKEIEQACERIRQQNVQLLSEFEGWLAARKLGENTIRKHVTNIDLYVNYFLLFFERGASLINRSRATSAGE
jgi:hypothetical protein